ncbi:MAG: FtsX-like permease family protein [Candidatus Rhabdochlamydia sp.]
MIFELSILRKYLVPRKRQLSVALLATVSVAVITTVVWLLLLFLSITEGIEKAWLHKLTSLHAPLRITPKDAYFKSYYYLADTLSSKASYQPRSFSEKLQDQGKDLYDPLTDPMIPLDWEKPRLSAEGTLQDPVTLLAQILESVKKVDPTAEYSPFELSGAVLKLQITPSLTGKKRGPQFLTQACYLQSFPENNSYLQALLIPPLKETLENLFTPLATLEQLSQFFTHATLQTVKTGALPWNIPYHLLPENYSIPAKRLFSEGKLHSLRVGNSNSCREGVLKRRDQAIFWNEERVDVPIFAEDPIQFRVTAALENAHLLQSLSHLKLAVEGEIGSCPLKGTLPWKELAPVQIALKETPLKTLSPPPLSSSHPVILAKGFCDLGVQIGDKGWIQYQAVTTGALQEQRLSVTVAGFYDPGVTPIGNKSLFASPDVVHLIQTSSVMQHFDPSLSSGFCVWHQDLRQTPFLKNHIQALLDQSSLSSYWKVTSYHDYEFSKDLLLQFQSDRVLFVFLGGIILIVACSNIISFLILLVYDKRKEIGILEALGASKKSIAFIFGACGALIGLLSTSLGILAALFTLKHLSSLVSALSWLQGYPAFNPAFYGSSLPSEMSLSALYFIVAAAPLLSLLAALIPALKACRLTPSEILRSE